MTLIRLVYTDLIFILSFVIFFFCNLLNFFPYISVSLLIFASNAPEKTFSHKF